MIEFILGLMIVISFFFFFVRMSAIFAVGNFVHYATFMAARAYSSSTTTPDAQKDDAAKELSGLIGNRFKTLIKGKEGDGSSIAGASIGPGPLYSTQDVWNQGVSFHYTSKLSLYPWSRDGQSILLDLTSDSWMAKEDSVSECESKKTSVVGFLSTANLQNITVEWDNGC